jgi:hypothetical protein
MSVPLSATFRIRLEYTVAGTLHNIRHYVRGATLTGGDYNIDSRTLGENDTLWTDAADGMANAIIYAFSTDITIGSAFLEQRTGTLWNVIAVHTVTVEPNASGATAFVGWQQTLVLRDKLFHKVKVIVLEGNYGTLKHAVALSGIPTAQQNFAKQYTSSFTITNPPFAWMVSRGNQFLDDAAFVGYTNTSNRRTRRGRGLT